MRRAAVALVVLLAAPAAHAIRPTDGDGWYGNGYDPGVPVFSFDSASGHFRVHYVTESVDAVQVGDADMDGVPDFVQLVAEHADTVWVSAIDQRGFRPPLDDSVYHDTNDWGGDARFDIYLLNISESDGYMVAEVCTDQPFWCSGYFAMENDFAGFGYPSDSIAIRVLTSHEFFHAVQDAYDADQDRKWTEGTATWNEEKVFPEQNDYEAFLATFLEKPERPFDRAGGGIVDPYPYGSAIWPTFLDERFGPDVVREVWEACEDLDGSNLDFLEAADLVLAATYGSSLEDAWVEFTHWNLFTDDRADPARAYAAGGDWPSVRLEDPVSGYPASVTVRSEGMSARYVPIVLPDRQGAPARLTVTTAVAPAVRAAAFLWDGTTLADGVAVAGGDDPMAPWADLTWSGTPTLFVAVTGISRGTLPKDVTVALADPPAEPPPPLPEPEDEPTCGCAAGPRGPGGSGAGALALVLVGAITLLGRRRSARP